MNSLLLVLLSLSAFAIAYLFYAKFLSEKIFALDPSRNTPAHTRFDGIDFVPTRPPVLFGHHFASIAGLGPILGPAIGVIYGWLPALLWVVLGTIFLGAVHDLGTLVVSLRHDGRTIGDLTEDLMGNRAKILFVILIFFVLALAMGVFCLVISGLFSKERPEAVIPTASLILIAMAIGTVVYKFKARLLPATIIGIVLMLATVYLGILVPVKNVSPSQWTYSLLLYAFVASVLPVWLLLQPRDYLNSFELYLAVGLLLLGVIVLHPPISAPVFHEAHNSPPLFPFLFILIACGAISGFHNLVSSGTTARQLATEKDARIIGYGGMTAEGVVALLAIVACTAAVGDRAEWLKSYADFNSANAATLNVFVRGAGALLASYGIPRAFAETFISVVVVAFAMTTLDTGTRLLRFNVEEIAETIKVKFLGNRYVASVIAVSAIGYFSLMKVNLPVMENGQIVYKLVPAGKTLWQLFGTTNQLLAAMGLLIVSIYLYRTKKPIWYALLPMAFMLVLTIYAMLFKLRDFWLETPRNMPLIVTSIILIIISLWILVEAVIVLAKLKKSSKEG